MPTIPSAKLSLAEQGGAFAGGTDYIAILGCAAKNADNTPRVFASASAALSEHDYSPAIDYIGLHVDATQKPVIFVGLPVAVAGALGRVNSSGVTGSSAISISAASEGYMEETVCSIEVVSGGTIGTDQITFNFSADGGRNTKLIRLGTGSSYTVPYLGIVISFGAGTLAANDLYTFTTSAPKWDSTGIANAKTALAAQQLKCRSFLIVGDLSNSTEAGYVTTAVNSYESSDNRYVYARAQARDRLPNPQMSQVKKTMSGSPSLTFALSGETCTRSTGSFITDGFAVGDEVTFSGSASNNISAKITVLTATVLTIASGFANEGPVSNVAMVGSNSLTFAAGDTVTRSGGSWLNDGFAVGDSVTFSGTASNNVTAIITTLTATVLTASATTFAAETVRSDLVTATAGETMAGWVSDITTAFASVDAQKRIDLAAGRARKESTIHQWDLRRPAAWAASIREYSHDLQIPCWRKADGPLDGWDMTDGNGKVVEYDERTDGGLLAARFTCLRTWANGPNGAFVALSLTRDTDGAILSRTHNMAVADLAEAICQSETENAIGQVLVLNADGTGTAASLQQIEERVNTQLQKYMLATNPPGGTNEGARASGAVWQADKSSILNVPGATLDGVLSLTLNGTLEQINTSVLVG